MIYGKFHQNRLIRLGCNGQTQRDMQTHGHTLGSIATYSVKITEYKNLIKRTPCSNTSNRDAKYWKNRDDVKRPNQN